MSGVQDQRERDEEALERALILERYNEEKEYELESDDSTSLLPQVRPNLGPVASLVKNALFASQIRKTIVDFNMKPSLNTTDVDEALEVGDIKQIQFEFSDGSTTTWYSWQPNDTSSKLHNIVERYGSGELEKLRGKTVDVYSGVRNRIITPPKTTHTDDLKYSIWRRGRAIDDLGLFGDNITKVIGRNKIKLRFNNRTVGKILGMVIPLMLVVIIPALSHIFLHLGFALISCLLLLLYLVFGTELMELHGPSALAEGDKRGNYLFFFSPYIILKKLFQRVNQKE